MFVRKIIVWLLLTAACFPFGGKNAHAYLCSAIDIEITTTPIPFQIPKRLTEARQLLGRLPEKADVLLIGDSLLANWPADMLRSQMPDRSIFNMAVGGAQTQHILWIVDQVPNDTIMPDKILLLIGTNNLTNKDISPCAIKDGISGVVKKLKVRWPSAEIDLITVPPRGPGFLFRNRDRKELNRLVISELYGMENVKIFDLDPVRLTCGQYAEDGPPMKASTGKTKREKCKNYANDMGHFTRAGYKTIFSMLMNPDSIVQPSAVTLQ